MGDGCRGREGRPEVDWRSLAGERPGEVSLGSWVAVVTMEGGRRGCRGLRARFAGEVVNGGEGGAAEGDGGLGRSARRGAQGGGWCEGWQPR